MDLRQLLQRYATAQPRRATGGLRALTGFDFQLRAYLADYVREFVGHGDVEATGASLLEAFSDYTRSESSSTVLVQAKRTLTTTALRKAAREFVVIDGFLEAEAEGFRPSVKFEVVAHAADRALTWDGFALPPGDPEEDRDRFESLRAEGRLLPPRVEPDPWWAMLASLTWSVDDPLALAREALDICLGRADATADEVHVAIQYAFTRRRLAVPPIDAVQYLATEDFAATDVRSANISVALPPTLELLLDEQYMERTEHVADAAAALELLVVQTQTMPSQQIDAFWIDGASASGKSVVLLQLMRSLARQGKHIAWLGNRGDRLAETLQRCATLDDDALAPDFIFVDDLYDPTNQERVNLEEIDTLVARRRDVRWPTVVTCGPPEFHETLAHRASSSIKVHLHPLPLVDHEEGRALKSWMGRRDDAPLEEEGRAFQRPGGLILSMALELRHGDLTAFARRFVARLTEAALADALRQPLALNRLYVSTPVAWLTDDELGRLEQINTNADFRVLGTPNAGSERFRLTHPHLSDAIYRALEERRHTPRMFANDLAGAFARAGRGAAPGPLAPAAVCHWARPAGRRGPTSLVCEVRRRMAIRRRSCRALHGRRGNREGRGRRLPRRLGVVDRVGGEGSTRRESGTAAALGLRRGSSRRAPALGNAMDPPVGDLPR